VGPVEIQNLSGRVKHPIARRNFMSRFPSHTIENAPEGSRPILQKIAEASQTKRPLNVHAQMAHSPAVLAGYASLRAITAERGTLDPKVSWALNLTTAATIGNAYMIGIASRFARMSGWTDAQVEALRTAATTGDTKIDAITSVIREAAAHSGKVTDAVWRAALQHGWSDTQLAEAFAYLGLTLFTGYFLNYAQTDADI
jgi:alkylhydroperoxidase family enzyme